MKRAYRIGERKFICLNDSEIKKAFKYFDRDSFEILLCPYCEEKQDNFSIHGPLESYEALISESGFDLRYLGRNNTVRCRECESFAEYKKAFPRWRWSGEAI